MSLPKRELLWFLRVLAFPKASRIGLVCEQVDSKKVVCNVLAAPVWVSARAGEEQERINWLELQKGENLTGQRACVYA